MDSRSEKILREFIDACKQFREDFDPETSFAEEGTGLLSDKVINTDEIFEQLNTIYTPILAAQAIDPEAADRVQEACSADNVLTESGVVKLDPDTRRAQLVSLCAMLLARQADSPDYKAYKEASLARKNLKLKIQRDNLAVATEVANEYLKNISATSSSADIRRAASTLLAE